MASESLGGGQQACQTPSSDEEDYHSAPEDSAHVTEAKDPPASAASSQGLEPEGESAEVNRAGQGGEGERGLDNHCVSNDQEGGGAKGERVELSEEQIKVRLYWMPFQQHPL